MRKKISKKVVSDFFIATKGDLNWCVFTFDKQTGKRNSLYAGYNFISALGEITKELARGKYDVLLTGKEGYDFCQDYECKGGFNGFRCIERVTRKMMQPYAIYIDEYSVEVKDGNYLGLGM